MGWARPLAHPNDPVHTIDIVLITLPSPSGSRSHSGCKAGDSGPHPSLLADRRCGPREGHETPFGRSGTACPVSRRQGSSVPMLDKRPPAGLVGIPQPLQLLATPTLLTSEADGDESALSQGCRETISPTGSRTQLYWCLQQATGS